MVSKKKKERKKKTPRMLSSASLKLRRFSPSCASWENGPLGSWTASTRSATSYPTCKHGLSPRDAGRHTSRFQNVNSVPLVRKTRDPYAGLLLSNSWSKNPETHTHVFFVHLRVKGRQRSKQILRTCGQRLVNKCTERFFFSQAKLKLVCLGKTVSFLPGYYSFKGMSTVGDLLSFK